MLSDRSGDRPLMHHGSPNLYYHAYLALSHAMKRVPLIAWMIILLVILGVFFYVVHQQPLAVF